MSSRKGTKRTIIEIDPPAQDLRVLGQIERTLGNVSHKKVCGFCNFTHILCKVTKLHREFTSDVQNYKNYFCDFYYFYTNNMIVTFHHLFTNNRFVTFYHLFTNNRFVTIIYDLIYNPFQHYIYIILIRPLSLIQPAV